MTYPDATRHYINGQWVVPHSAQRKDIINPADKHVIGQVALGDAVDADAAVAAAHAAFESWSQTSVAERLTLLRKINDGLIARNDELAEAISAEMGAPKVLAHEAQAPSGTQHFAETIRVLENYDFEEKMGSTLVRREPIGVCVLITPWNWPLNQIAVKVAPALAAGCTMVLKPSELAPLDAVIFTQILHDAGVPPGVFNLVQGDGPGVGDALTGHRLVDMVSFTGSTRAGIAISQNAAKTIKRVALELGGKSANILLDDADFAKAVRKSIHTCMNNSGQSCNAPTRMFVPAARYAEVKALAAETVAQISFGNPGDDPVIG
ncbi:MAG: aldehyde dehydrogenase family protein, partial [Alphaproteobacteria bacterium]|nr:aldehyde dehydrogenase family protein [Alphaproteobacteria bacterium]